MPTSRRSPVRVLPAASSRARRVVDDALEGEGSEGTDEEATTAEDFEAEGRSRGRVVNLTVKGETVALAHPRDLPRNAIGVSATDPDAFLRMVVLDDETWEYLDEALPTLGDVLDFVSSYFRHTGMGSPGGRNASSR